MAQQPVLVVMAAGLGSRYGGLKQIDPVGPNGQILLDYSIYDAYRAGFRQVVFIIRPELQESFAETIGRRAARQMEVSYVYQTTDHLPEGLQIPAGRTKPLGTAHAVWCAGETVKAPFAVINADDFYGAEAFCKVYSFLQNVQDDDVYRYCLVGYPVENTLSDSGTVARGVCTAGPDGLLTAIVERTAIQRAPDGVIRCEGGQTLPEGTPVSMNLWGFTPSFLAALSGLMRDFICEELPKNPEKAEFYLPFAVDRLIAQGRATAALLHTTARWFGVTYQQDKPAVQDALAEMTRAGEYPAAF